MITDISMPLENERVTERAKHKDFEAVFDGCVAAFVMAIVVYGICEAIARWRWWAVGIWIGTALLIPVVIVACQTIAEFLEREDY